MGVFVVYFLDYTLGSAWWVMVLYLIQVIRRMITKDILITIFIMMILMERMIG